MIDWTMACDKYIVNYYILYHTIYANIFGWKMLYVVIIDYLRNIFSFERLVPL